MLILDRKESESVLIGDDVQVVITKITELPNGKFQVALGIDAPRHINIDRPEVRQRRIKNIEKAFNGNNK